VFDPFFTTKEVGEGTGLGLSIVYGIIKDHEGSIAIENNSGGGAHFVIRLPLASEPS
jgi:two-component system C4-dicarboxylate transport sensor histidine kinase DctB